MPVAPHRLAGDGTASRLPVSPTAIASAPIRSPQLFPRLGPPHRPPLSRWLTASSWPRLYRPIQGCSTRALDGRVDPKARCCTGGVRGDAGADRCPFWRLPAQVGASRPGQAQERSVLWSSSGRWLGSGAHYLDRNHALGHAADRKMRPAGRAPPRSCPQGHTGRVGIFMKSTCNNCKNGLHGQNFAASKGGTVTSGPHLGSNASGKAPFGGECKNLRVEFARLRNSVRREAPL